METATIIYSECDAHAALWMMW